MSIRDPRDTTPNRLLGGSKQMVRKWYVRPRPETGIVAPEDLAQAMVDASTVLTAIGGVLGIVQDRAPTGMDGEMVTVFVMIEWKDRTDAKPQPEPATAPQVEPDPTPEELEEHLAEEEFLAEAERAEDTSSMEPAAR